MEELEYMKSRVIAGRMSRRDFLGRAAALGVALPLATSLFEAAAEAATPQKGGTLSLGMVGGATTDSLDPTTYLSQTPAQMGAQFGNTLILMSPKGEPTGALAESWEGQDAAKRWVFKLRKGVTFSNGKTLDADDVVFSLNRHRGPNSKSGAAGQMKVISDIKASAPDEVTITLSEANADLPYLISDYHLIIQPNNDKGDSGIGTGPYIIDSADPGVRYTSKRNPNYWKPDAAYFDSIETIVINDPTARLAALQSGKVHAIDRVEPKVVSLLKKSPGVTVINSRGRGHYPFLMHCDKAPFDNADLRLAMKYAIDREQLLKQILFGYGSVGNDQPINSAYPFFSNDIPQYKYDPDKAKFHYKKSGHDGSIVLETSDVAFSGAVDAAVLYQQTAGKAGITIEVKRDPGDGYWDNVWNKQPFCTSYWQGRPTQDQMLSIAYKSDAAWNDTKWFRPDFDKILGEARAELDPAKRKSLYREADLMIHDDGGAIIPMFNDFLDGLSKKVKGYVADPNGDLSNNLIVERCWFES